MSDDVEKPARDLEHEVPSIEGVQELVEFAAAHLEDGNLPSARNVLAGAVELLDRRLDHLSWAAAQQRLGLVDAPAGEFEQLVRDLPAGPR